MLQVKQLLLDVALAALSFVLRYDTPAVTRKHIDNGYTIK